MRQVATYLLLFAVLMANVSWAMDDCLSQSANTVAELDSAELSSVDGQVCDTSCIGWFHFVMLVSDLKFEYFPRASEVLIFSNNDFRSLNPAPPTRPPQV